MNKTIKELTEKWADIEHKRWAKWQKYMHSKMERSYDFTTYNLPEELYNRWKRQIATEYKDLSEEEKESDREQVYPYIEDVKELMKEAKQQEKQRWLSGNVCTSCGEDIVDSKGLTNTCSECFENK